MPTWLSDPSGTSLILAGVVLLITGGIWIRTRNRKALLATGIAALILVGWILCDQFVESPRETAVRKIQLMVQAYNANKWADFQSHISQSQKLGAPDTIRKAFDLGRNYQVQVNTWGYDRELVKEIPGGIEIAFDASATSPQLPKLPKHVRAIFIKDPDGEYRMQSFTTYNIVQKQNPEPIPGMP